MDFGRMPIIARAVPAGRLLLHCRPPACADSIGVDPHEDKKKIFWAQCCEGLVTEIEIDEADG